MVREFAREDDFRVLLVLDPHPGELSTNSKTLPGERFERAVTTCAGIAWHFYERNAFLHFAAPESKPILLPLKKIFL